MKNWLKENGLHIAITGIGGFMCIQIYAMRSELSSVAANVSSINERTARLEGTVEKFYEKHANLEIKINDLENKLTLNSDN